jgi:hypothetical protein
MNMRKQIQKETRSGRNDHLTEYTSLNQRETFTEMWEKINNIVGEMIK